MAADEAMKAFLKGQNTGSMFKLDLDLMKSQRLNAESYVRVWLTAWQSKLSAEELEIAHRHKILWLGQAEQAPLNYPMNGVPENTAQAIAIAATGKCGIEHAGTNALDANAEQLVLSRISGEVIADAQADYYDRVSLIKKAMEKFRHYATVALGEKLNGPFDQGILTSYKQLMKWVYKKCNVTRSAESMADLFQDVHKALNEKADADCKILKFRLAISKLYQDGSATAIAFPDIEDEQIALQTKEKYEPIQAFWFLYNLWCLIDSKTWQAIEDEFRGEIGGTNYNKANWMAHKPRLFEIIDQKTKGVSSRASINAFQENESDEDEKVEVEIEPGVIMYMSPKGPRNNRPSNWKQKVQKYTAAAKRGQKQQNDRSGYNQRSNNNNNRTNNNYGNSPAQFWNCRECPTVQGRPTRHKRGQKCPLNNFIPQRMIASVQDEEKSEQRDEEKKEVEKEGLRAVKAKIAPAKFKFNDYDSSGSEDKSF